MTIEEFMKGRECRDIELYFFTIAAHSTIIKGVGGFKKYCGQRTFSTMVSALDEAFGRVQVMNRWLTYKNEFPQDAEIIMDTGKKPNRRKTEYKYNGQAETLYSRKGDGHCGRFVGWDNATASPALKAQLDLVNIDRQKNKQKEIEYMEKHKKESKTKKVDGDSDGNAAEVDFVDTWDQADDMTSDNIGQLCENEDLVKNLYGEMKETEFDLLETPTHKESV